MSRSFIGKCGFINHFTRGCKRLFLQIHDFSRSLDSFQKVIFPHQWGLFLPSNIVHKEGLDRSFFSFLKAHFQSKDLVPYLIPVMSKGCVYLFVWLLGFFDGDKSLSLK